MNATRLVAELFELDKDIRWVGVVDQNSSILRNVQRPGTQSYVDPTIEDGLRLCYLPNRIYCVSPDQNIDLLIEDATGEVLSQPTNVAFEPKGTRLFIAGLGGKHIGALDVGEAGAPLKYPSSNTSLSSSTWEPPQDSQRASPMSQLPRDR